MKFKVSALMALLLVGCQHDYNLDHSLKKAWAPDLENTQPSRIPYGLVYNVGNKQILYVAVNSGNKKVRNNFLNILIEKRKPDLVLFQGASIKEKLTPERVRINVKGHQPVLKGASATREQILENLKKYGITERDYVLFQTILLMNQVWLHETKTPLELQTKAAHYLKTDPNAEKFGLTYRDLQHWFYEKMGTPLTYQLIQNSEMVAPKDPQLKTTNALQKISSYEDQIDDAIVIETLGQSLGEYNKIMIIRAGSKYVSERDVLHKMLNVSGPTEIVN